MFGEQGMDTAPVVTNDMELCGLCFYDNLLFGLAQLFPVCVSHGV